MTIRIISGKFRGKGIPSPPRSKPIRPTSSLIRESVFNRFPHRLEGARFLDAFAGSGIMSLEALSRGMSYVLALELETRQCREIRTTFEDFGLTASESAVLCTDARKFLARPCKELPFDWIFMDPPYGFEGLADLVACTLKNGWLKDNGVFIVEHGRRDPDFPDFSRREYGDTSISCFVNGLE
jgi:16S rRNA (guanine966-N2)-methyltransferase